ncbi:Uma2 family endonuclease [Caldalkalibacillus uzonensis]|uniref:Uma2 family endonuclease n=1 Tax=Caldalkalibacillus uzonensis TaxID=353224 RepID=A0ABU0CPN7_9BACI|nr:MULTISPECIES: Uma2 family endonuclease [Caldalkalibacillus]MDQ0338376.1 Uma2 family endonuclease [Caldalkalibacillus uzonensis]GGK23368.1 hypothetical protein GCM10010965_15210 [Caldalkalibacillus thermarum]
MNLPQKSKISLEEFYKMREETNDLLEYVDGIVLMTPSPSTKHQRVSGRLQAKLFNFLEGTNCEVFSAPYDIELKKDGIEGTKILVPDLSVICDKQGLQENKFVGVPDLIIEILSPSNQSNDLVTKMNLYMQYGVKEYWIINPMLNAVQIYVLDEKGHYQQKDILKEIGTVESEILKGFQVELEDIFRE